jgi:predicted nucleic acid-binding protein
MPVESGVIDTNVLVYALDADAPQHATSRALLEAAHRRAVGHPCPLTDIVVALISLEDAFCIVFCDGLPSG